MIRKTNSSDRIFIVIIGLLLVANIATLTMLFSRKNAQRDEHKNEMRKYLKEDIGFTEAQLVRFDTLKSEHRRQVKELFDSVRRQKQEGLKKLGISGFSDSLLISAASEAAAAQRQVELRMLSHLKNVRDLCTPPQQAEFDTGFYKILMKSAGGAKKKGN